VIKDQLPTIFHPPGIPPGEIQPRLWDALAAYRATLSPAHQSLLDRYELYIYKQWLRVYMRSKMIKHNKDLLQCVGDDRALLEKLHIY